MRSVVVFPQPEAQRKQEIHHRRFLHLHYLQQLYPNFLQRFFRATEAIVYQVT